MRFALKCRANQLCDKKDNYMKKRFITTILVVGIVIFGTVMLFEPIENTWEYIAIILSVVMIVASLIALCVLNYRGKEKSTDTVDLGFHLLEMILDFFIG